jgi:hypothetical protein
MNDCFFDFGEWRRVGRVFLYASGETPEKYLVARKTSRIFAALNHYKCRTFNGFSSLMRLWPGDFRGYGEVVTSMLRLDREIFS